MPLKDLFSKAPAPIAPSEEPCPKQPPVLQQQEVSSHPEGSCDFKRSPLYSATSRPTLDEFLRTNYLMIPEFVMQVNQAKKAAGIVENEHCVQNITPAQSEDSVHVREGTPTVFPADRNQTFSDNTKEAKYVEKKESTVENFRSTATKIADKVTAVVSGKQISSEEIHVPSPLNPKPRVKKVMKGGSLVTIPAPQPRNRTLTSMKESSEGINRATTTTKMPENSECGKNVVNMPERKSHEETLDGKSVKEKCDNQSEMEGDSNLIHGGEGDLPKEVPPKGGKNLQSKVLEKKCEQRPVSLTSIQSTDRSCQDKNSENDISDDSLQGQSSKTARKNASLKYEESNILHSRGPQLAFNKETNNVGDERLRDRSIKHSKLTTWEMRSVVDKALIENGRQELIDNPTSSSKAVRHPGRKPSTCMINSHERNANREPMGEADGGLGNSCTPLDPHIVMSKDCGIKESGERPHDFDIVTTSQKICKQNEKEEVACAKKSSESEETHAEKDRRAATGDVEAVGITSSIDKNDGWGTEGGEIMGANAEDSTCDVIAAKINGNERKTDDDVDDDGDDGDTPGDDNNSADVHIDDDHDGDDDDTPGDDNNSADVHVDDDHDGDDDEEEGGGDGDTAGDDNNSADVHVDDDHDGDDDEEEGGGDGGLGIKGNSSAEESDEDYAELIMDDSNSEEEDEDDFIPGNGDDSDEEEGEVNSDYEPEDMALDSDTESAVGGITFCQDTALNKRRNHSKGKRRAKRKAKNQKKKASKKRTKAEKQAATERNRASVDPGSNEKSAIEKPVSAAISQKSAPNGPKNVGPQIQKPPETLPKPQADIATAQKKPSGQGVSEEGSLLAMVSSYAVDVTVAASEKLALKRSRGGQHAKKLKKAKRRAAALERIRKGDPPPRTRRVQQPKALCNYYIQGKCRKGEECPFRHDKSAVVKKKELCKFYVSNSCLLGDGCIYMHNSFPCKFFHTGSNCWAAERCKFSHDALTEETSQLLQLHLNPPVEDPAQSAQDAKVPNGDKETPGISHLTLTEDKLQASTSSPYNLRTSTRKRRLSTSEAEVGHVTDAKSSRQESPQPDQSATNEKQSSSFLPGLYKDLSM